MTKQWDGRPQNPERDGWHWLHHRIESTPQPVRWIAEIDAWASDAAYSPEGVIELGWRYRGPCLTPAEVAAREAAARREGIEAAALAAANYQLNNDGCAAAIRALLEDGR